MKTAASVFRCERFRKACSLSELVRYRRSIIEDRARQHNRIQKVKEGANINLGSVVSDIMGLSSKTMLLAIAEGEEDPVTAINFLGRFLNLILTNYLLGPYEIGDSHSTCIIIL